MKEITVEQLRKKIDNRETFLFLDVREPFETYISAIDIETVHIPMEELTRNIHKLDKDSEIIVMCRSGNRSKSACELLESEDFKKVSNLKGGINAWAAKIDTSLPQY